MKTPALIAALTILAGTAAPAQSLFGLTPEGGNATVALNFHDDGTNDPIGENSTTQLSGYSAYGLGGNFGLGFSLGYSEERYDGSFLDNRLHFGAHPFVKLSQGTFGGYLILVEELSGPEDGDMIGIEGTYDFGNFGVEGYLGTMNTNASYGNFGMAARYEVSPALEAYAFYRSDDYNVSDYISLTGIGASYRLSGSSVILSGEISSFHWYDPSASVDSTWGQFSLMATWMFGNESKPSVFHQQYSVESYYD